MTKEIDEYREVERFLESVYAVAPQGKVDNIIIMWNTNAIYRGILSSSNRLLGWECPPLWSSDGTLSCFG